MRSHPIILLSLALVLASFIQSCGSGEAPAGKQARTVSIFTGHHTSDTSMDNTTDMDTSQYATAYLVIADTGQDYYVLRNKMYGLYNMLKWPVDTLGRYYNKQRKEIVLPEDDEDELYRGEYFPRRGKAATLSLEYYRSYNDSSSVKNIALVASISETEQEADSLLRILKKQFDGAFLHKTKIYMGCMH